MTANMLAGLGLVLCLAVAAAIFEWAARRSERRDRAQAQEDAMWHAEALRRADAEGRILQAEPDFRGNRRAKLEWRRSHWGTP